MSTAGSTWNLWGDLWSTGNWWARRLLISVVLWHLLTLLVGLIGVPTVTILFMVTVGSALTIMAIWYSQPLIPILAMFTSGGRTAINWIAIVIGLELALGMYLATVPVGINWTTRGLALLALGAALTAIVLKISHTGWKLPIAILWLKFAVLTLVIYAYGLMPDMLSALREAWLKDQARAAEKVRRGESIWTSLAAAIQLQTVPQSATAPARQIQKVQIYPNKDVDVVAPHGATDVWIEPPGELTYTFPSGKTVTVPANDHLKFALPSREFKLRGDPGIATITWSF